MRIIFLVEDLSSKDWEPSLFQIFGYHYFDSQYNLLRIGTGSLFILLFFISFSNKGIFFNHHQVFWDDQFFTMKFLSGKFIRTETIGRESEWSSQSWNDVGNYNSTRNKPFHINLNSKITNDKWNIWKMSEIPKVWWTEITIRGNFQEELEDQKFTLSTYSIVFASRILFFDVYR